MMLNEIVNKLISFLPSSDRFPGSITFDNYRAILFAAAIMIAIIVLFIVYLIKSKHIRLPLLTEVGMSMVGGGMIAVADGLISDISDPIAIAIRWFFICAGFVIIFISGTICYMSLNRKIKKKGQRMSDMMPLDQPIEFRNPKGVHSREDWHG